MIDHSSFVMAQLRESLLEAFTSQFTISGGRVRPKTKKPSSDSLGNSTPFGKHTWKSIVKEISNLHGVYTSSGSSFAHEENPIHENMAGYQFYFLPRNLFRVLHVLDSLPWRENPLSFWVGNISQGRNKNLEVLDLGCGSGAFSLAIISWLAEHNKNNGFFSGLNITLVDQGHALLGMADANIRALAQRVLPEIRLNISSHSDGVERYLSSKEKRSLFAIVGSAMLFNELNLLASRRGKSRATRFVTPLLRLLREGGLILLVEPGTRKGYMNLMAVREQVTKFPILYPCPHQRPCPLWDPRVKNWCHSNLSLPPSFFFDDPLRRLGNISFGMKDLNLCGLAFQITSGGRLQGPFKSISGSRIVSGQLNPRGGKEKAGSKEGEKSKVVLKCGADGKLREVSAKPFSRFPRGQWVGENQKD